MRTIIEALVAGVIYAAVLILTLTLAVGPLIYIAANYPFEDGWPYVLGWAFIVFTFMGFISFLTQEY